MNSEYTLKNFFQKHQEKILRELQQAKIKIKKENINKIIEETSFRIRSKKYPNECLYYQANPKTPCHETLYLKEDRDLNCFLCGCHVYKSDLAEGGCEIQSPEGVWFKHPNLEKGKIWDCSNCYYPHTPKVTKTYLKENINKLRLKSFYLSIKDNLTKIKSKLFSFS